MTEPTRNLLGCFGGSRSSKLGRTLPLGLATVRRGTLRPFPPRGGPSPISLAIGTAWLVREAPSD